MGDTARRKTSEQGSMPNGMRQMTIANCRVVRVHLSPPTLLAVSSREESLNGVDEIVREAKLREGKYVNGQ